MKICQHIRNKTRDQTERKMERVYPNIGKPVLWPSCAFIFFVVESEQYLKKTKNLDRLKRKLTAAASHSCTNIYSILEM